MSSCEASGLTPVREVSYLSRPTVYPREWKGSSTHLIGRRASSRLPWSDEDE